MKNKSGMSIISSMLLLAALSFIMLSMTQRAFMAYEMAEEAERIFLHKEALNSLAQTSVFLAIKLMKSYATKEQFPQKFTGECQAWPYAEGKKGYAHIVVTIESPVYCSVSTRLEVADQSRRGIAYVLALRDNQWQVEDWRTE